LERLPFPAVMMAPLLLKNGRPAAFGATLANNTASTSSPATSTIPRQHRPQHITLYSWASMRAHTLCWDNGMTLTELHLKGVTWTKSLALLALGRRKIALPTLAGRRRLSAVFGGVGN